MRLLRQFEEFVKEGIARKISPDRERAKNLMIESDRKLVSLSINLKKVGVTEQNANDFIEYCYDLLMCLIRAKLFADGYSCSGIGAHEAEVAYTRKIGLQERETMFLDQLRSYRNGILYYGKRLDQEYAEKVVEFTQKTYPLLKLIAVR